MAYTKWHSSDSFLRQHEQTSEKIYLDREKEYYYEAYLGDHGGIYTMQLGLLGFKTQQTASKVRYAQDEMQKIRIYSNYKKAIQVSLAETISTSTLNQLSTTCYANKIQLFDSYFKQFFQQSIKSPKRI